MPLYEHDRPTPEPERAVMPPGISIDEPVTEHWRPLTACPVLIIVGLAGVGKSSTLNLLRQEPVPITLLPDRRFLTEQRIVAPLQQQTGHTWQAVSRIDRYPYVRQFLEQHPGGMAEILARMAVHPALQPAFFVFDGLRGPHEIAYALRHFPLARFAEFTAPSLLRVERLLARNDPHDQLASTSLANAALTDLTFASLGVPAARTMFSPAEERTLCAEAAGNPSRASALKRVLEIMAEEYALYAPDATHALLAPLEPGRMVLVDTSICTPGEAVASCLGLFGAGNLE